jgi:hypothetical protein
MEERAQSIVQRMESRNSLFRKGGGEVPDYALLQTLEPFSTSDLGLVGEFEICGLWQFDFCVQFCVFLAFWLVPRADRALVLPCRPIRVRPLTPIRIPLRRRLHLR